MTTFFPLHHFEYLPLSSAARWKNSNYTTFYPSYWLFSPGCLLFSPDWQLLSPSSLHVHMSDFCHFSLRLTIRRTLLLKNYRADFQFLNAISHVFLGLKKGITMKRIWADFSQFIIQREKLSHVWKHWDQDLSNISKNQSCWMEIMTTSFFL